MSSSFRQVLVHIYDEDEDKIQFTGYHGFDQKFPIYELKPTPARIRYMKTGWKTSEFWVTAFSILALFAGAVSTALTSVNFVSPKFAVIGMAIAAFGYAVSRGLAKMFPPKDSA